MKEPPKAYRITLKKGIPIENCYMAVNAPQIPGFIAIEWRILETETCDKKDATKYINIDNITDIVVVNEEFKKWPVTAYVPERIQKVELSR